MNERIKLLVEEARLISVDNTTRYASDDEFEQKFAELIVLECIREIGYKSAELLDIDFYPHYQEQLKKYFGVEE